MAIVCPYHVAGLHNQYEVYRYKYKNMYLW